MTNAAVLGGTSLYPQRRERKPFREILRDSCRVSGAGRSRVLQIVCREESGLSGLAAEAFRDRLVAARLSLRKRGLTPETTGTALALVGESVRRDTGRRPDAADQALAWSLLNGSVAEVDPRSERLTGMATAAAVAAMAGIRTHLVFRDEASVGAAARWLARVSTPAGLVTAPIREDDGREARKRAYESDIVCVTAKELALDYLKDRTTLRGHRIGSLRLRVERLYGKDTLADRLILRGMPFAVLDDIDEVLIDEARVPVALTRREFSPENERLARESLDMARRFDAGADFQINDGGKGVSLNGAGRAKLEDMTANREGVWQVPRLREELLTQAIVALVLYHRDRHYRVQGGRVMVLEEQSGAEMQDRYWGSGLHRLLEIKEGCPVSGERVPVARTTYQSFFKQYELLGGVTIHAGEARAELRRVFGLNVIDLRGKRRRRPAADVRLFARRDEAWQAVADLLAANGPALPSVVCARAAETAKGFSRFLRDEGVAHRVASAVELADPALQSCGILVTTGDELRAALKSSGTFPSDSSATRLIMIEAHEERRLEAKVRCIFDPDTLAGVHVILSAEDPLLRAPGTGASAGSPRGLLAAWGARSRLAALRLAQLRKERERRLARRQLLSSEEQLVRMLAFSGSRD